MEDAVYTVTIASFPNTQFWKCLRFLFYFSPPVESLEVISMAAIHSNSAIHKAVRRHITFDTVLIRANVNSLIFSFYFIDYGNNIGMVLRGF